MNYLVDRVEAERLKFGTQVQRLEPAPENALAYLQAQYRDPTVDPVIRRRCAMACLPFESPKFAVVANVGGDFGADLDRLIEAKRRSEAVIKDRYEADVEAEVERRLKGEPPKLAEPIRMERRF